MPTKNPRLQVPLDQETYDIVEELAQVRGVSKASIVREIVELMAPTLERTAKVLKDFARKESRLRQESEGAVAGMKLRAMRSVSDAEDAINPALEALSLMMDSLASQAAEPPHSNTGVTSQPNVNSEGRKSPKVQELRANWHGDCKR